MRTKKLFLILALLLTAVTGAWADTYDYPDKTKPEFYASYGGKSNVVVINTAAELAYITEHFDENSEFPVEDDDWSELNYYLNADINMGNSYSWMPLGRESYWVTRYSGTFWGNGHTITYMIRGLKEENQGLFSTIHEDGKVYDVNVVCEIYTQRDYVGGICGENYGTIENCTVTANIVSEDHERVGGITGENAPGGIVKGCHVMGTIKGTESAKYVGGITGQNRKGAGAPEIVNCWVEADVSSEHDNGATGAYVGGIAGNNNSFIRYCCMTGNVTNPEDDRVGGIVGNNAVGGHAGPHGTSAGTVEHCTFYGVIDNDHSRTSDFIGEGYGKNLYREFSQAEYDDAVSKGHALYAYAILNVFALSVTTTGTGTVTVRDFNAETIDYDKVPTDHWIYVYITSGVVSSFIVKDADGNDVEVIRYHQYGDNYYMFPMPRSNVSVTVNFTTQQGDGSEENPYVISNAEEWKDFADKVNDRTVDYTGKFVMLGGDFTLGSYSTVGNGYSFINAFKGTLDGNGHTITISNTPPFGHVMDATIKNLNIAGDATLSSWSGCIVQHWNGTLNLINCRVSVNVNCLGDQYFGGLAGQMYIPGSGASTNPNTVIIDIPGSGASTNPNTVIIDGCVFDGSFNSTVENEYRATDCSGFVGDAGEGGTVVIRNSLLKPASVGTGILSNTFAKMGNNGTLTIENSYFVATDNLPANQGTEAVASATAPVNLGSLVEDYGMVKAYQNGILVGGTYYVAPATVTLADGSDNTAVITDADGYVADVTLAARTLYKDGAWNTICLPFNVTLAGSPLEGAVARPLTEGGISGTTLNLTFGDAVTELVAATTSSAPSSAA